MYDYTKRSNQSWLKFNQNCSKLLQLVCFYNHCGQAMVFSFFKLTHLFRSTGPRNLNCGIRRWDQYPWRCIFRRVGTDPGFHKHRCYSPAESATIKKHHLIWCTVCLRRYNLMSRHHICFIACCFATQACERYWNIDKDLCSMLTFFLFNIEYGTVTLCNFCTPL